MLENFQNNLNIAVFGGSGGIGKAIIAELQDHEKVKKIYSFSRSKTSFNHEKILENEIDIVSEDSIKNAAAKITENLDIIIIATGLLHDEKMQPEKSLKDLNFDNLLKSYLVNAAAPAMIAKHFAQFLPRDKKAIFTAISARVSSISDNYLGGWYAYRASKTALNQLLKTLSIELARKNKEICVFGLHPGTVATKLSTPFQTNVAKEKLFSAEFAAQSLLKTLSARSPKDNGKLFAWDNSEIPY